MFNLIEVQVIQENGQQEPDWINPAHIIRVSRSNGKNGILTRLTLTYAVLFSAQETPDSIMQKMREAVIPYPLARDN